MKRRLVRFFIFVALVVGIPAALTYRSWFPDIAWLRIAEVQINAEAPIQEAELRKLLPKLHGKSLFLVSAVDLIARCQKNPWVQSVAVKKEYPNRITLIAQSRKAVALKQENGRMTFIDDKGAEIDRWTATRLPGSDLPVIAFEKSEWVRDWNISVVVDILLSMQKILGDKYRISQLVPVEQPYFKVYLAKPSLELLFSRATWEGQLPFFLDLVRRPPRRIGQAHRINLVFPKKAVVSLPFPN